MQNINYIFNKDLGYMNKDEVLKTISKIITQRKYMNEYWIKIKL